MKKPKVIVICGPTATGKSAYAVRLAKKVGGEIICADSRQVYRGLDLLSGKIKKSEMRGIPHHLLDIANSKKVFAVSDFQMLTNTAIAEIVNRGKIPIIVGGTGFYIDAVIYDRALPEVPPNTTLRKKLALQSNGALLLTLRKLDPRRAKTIDPHNKVRLIRAIEIAKALGKVPTLPSRTSKYNVEWIYLDLPDRELKKRIHTRLLARMKSGMIREAQKLHESGISWKRMYELGLECRYAALYLQKKLTESKMLEELEKEIWRYAKRQRTWFKKYKGV